MFERMEHYTQYVQELRRLKKYYITEAPVILATYYSLDPDNSLFDESYNAPYEYVGNLSGIRYNKITAMPVQFTSPVANTLEQTEKGVEVSNAETEMTVAVPTGLRPKVGDLVSFNDGGSVGLTLDPNIIYVVKNFETSGMGANPSAIKATLEPASIPIFELEQQINEEYLYIDTFTSIFRTDHAAQIVELNLLYNDIYEYIKTFISTKTQMFILKQHQIYPDFLEDIGYYVNLIMNDRTDPGAKAGYSNLSQSRVSVHNYILFDLLYKTTLTNLSFSNIVQNYITATNVVKPIITYLYANTLQYRISSTGTDNVMKLVSYDDTQITNLQLYLELLHNSRSSVEPIDPSALTPDSVLTQLIHDYLLWKIDPTTLTIADQHTATNLIEAMFEFKVVNEQINYMITNKRVELQ